jgi:hypothetical protein
MQAGSSQGPVRRKEHCEGVVGKQMDLTMLVEQSNRSGQLKIHFSRTAPFRRTERCPKNLAYKSIILARFDK